MLGELSSRDNNLSRGDAVVRQENDFEQVADIGVVINFVRDVVDEFDDGFGVEIARSGFSSNHANSWHEFLASFMGRGVLYG